MILRHRPILDELLASRNGLNVNSVHFVSDDVMGKEAKDRLNSVGLESCEPIYFSVLGPGYPARSESKQVFNMHGCTTAIRIQSSIEQVIFLQKEVPHNGNIPKEFQDDWRSMAQLCAFLHELGHVEDIKKMINFFIEPKPTVRLLQAEAYAHTYALNYLSHIGATIARDTIAVTLRKFKQSKSTFEKDLYGLVCASVGKGRMKKWAES